MLYVDDERAIGRALRSWLTRRGHTVFTAASLDEAKKVLETSKVDGAFIDIWLGSESGFELFEWLEMNHPDVAANVVFVTGDIIPDRCEIARPPSRPTIRSARKNAWDNPWDARQPAVLRAP